MKSVNKQYLEDMVIKTTWQMLNDKETIHTIAENLYKIHETESKDNLTLKALENERNMAVKACTNLIAALEAGFITEQTKTRLKELETQISGLDFDIEQEKQRSYTYLTIPIIEEYLNSIIFEKEDNIEVRKLIVKTFIREVILHNDKVIITYNFTDNYDIHKITADSIAEIEKQSQLPTALPFTSGSYNLPKTPP